jgi:hypothetical protein
MRATAGVGASNVVDLYNGATGAWSTAQLSVSRWGLAAASVGNVALFAGGATSGALLCREGREWVCLLLRAYFVLVRAAVLRLCLPCDRFLSHARHCRGRCFFKCCRSVQQCNWGMVDGSAQRGALLACSCIGRERGFVRWGLRFMCVVVQGGEGVGVFIVACVFCGCACCGIAVVFALRPLPLSCTPLQMVLFLML